MMAKKPVDPTSKPTYFPNKSKQVKKQQISLNLKNFKTHFFFNEKETLKPGNVYSL